MEIWGVRLLRDLTLRTAGVCDPFCSRAASFFAISFKLFTWKKNDSVSVTLDLDHQGLALGANVTASASSNRSDTHLRGEGGYCRVLRKMKSHNGT